MTIDEVLERIRAHLNLEAQTEHELLEEIRAHLEEAVDAAQTQGMDPQEALVQAAVRFGLEDVARELHATHAGWGALEGIAAAALPVLLALILRWLVFNPDGTTVGWQEMLDRPAVWSLAVVVLLLPLLRFPRRRYALVAWAIFWGLSVAVVAAQAVHW